jgi:hypothetical protein
MKACPDFEYKRRGEVTATAFCFSFGAHCRRWPVGQLAVPHLCGTDSFVCFAVGHVQRRMVFIT